MIDDRTPHRAARDDETCSCGGEAVVVYLTDEFGEIPSCGLSFGELVRSVDRHPAGDRR